MEKTLRYSETKYRTLVEQIPAITYTISLAAGVDFLYVSPQVETLLGFSPDEWRADAENWERVIHPEDRERLLAEISHSLKSGDPFSTEYRLLAKSGRVVWFRDEARVIYDPEDQLLFLQGLALDITERKQAEEALRETTHTLQTLIQASPLAIIALNRDLTIKLWNPGAERMFGWKESEVLGGYLPCIPPDQLAEEDTRLNREMAGEVQSALELRRVRRDGSIIYVHLWNAPLLDAYGEPIGNMGILADITESKRAARPCRRPTTGCGPWCRPLPWPFSPWTSRGGSSAGIRRRNACLGGVRKRSWGGPCRLSPQARSKPSRRCINDTLQGIPLLGLELRRQRRDGSLIDIRLSTASLYDGAGAMTGIMGIIEDITEPKRMAETLRQVSRALKAITECHQALIRATDEMELLNEVCRIIVEVGGYRMAWVGYAEDDAHKSVRPVAQTGFDEGYVEQLNLTWADKERGRGPVGTAIRLGQPVVVRDTLTDRNFDPWREAARQRNFRSVLGLPLIGVAPFGALSIYATEPNAFDDEEINLLLGLANDLAYGIMALRGRAEQRRAEEALKESEQELRQLTSQLLSIQEKERRRVARELHDELGQALTVLKINLVAIEDKLAPDQQHLKANCEHMLSYIDTVIENVRRLSWDLSPSSLEDLGLSAALGYLVDETCRNHNMQCAVVMDEIDHLFPPEIQINIYRIFQESLTNVVKHARASLVSVNVTREDGKVSFMIRDNGRGFNVKQAMSGKVAKRSLGLTAMNERALMARGSLQISSRRGQGTTIAFSIPTDKRGK